MKHKVLILYLGNFYFDARCINMSLSLIKNNCNVSIISTHQKEYFFDCLSKINILKISLTKNGILKYLQFYKKVNAIIKHNVYDSIICADLYCLASGVKHKNGAKIIYDAREIYSDLFAHEKKPWLKTFCSLYENYYLKFVDHVLVTAKSDELYLKKKYVHLTHLHWSVIYNYPKFFTIKKNIDKMNDNDKQIKILYQGVIQRGRGIQKLINLVNSTKEFSAIIIGSGDAKGSFIRQTKQLQLTDKIIFVDAVPYLKLHKHAGLGDCGWALIDNSNLSNSFALPNKLFEYALMGLPVIASNIENMKKIIEKHNLGRVVLDPQMANLNSSIKSLIKNKNTPDFYHRIIKENFTWDVQHDKFLAIFNE